MALSAECLPEAVLAPLPHLYPFIVNDPGEGTQAKRRAQAVIIDHLTPPLTRAGSYGLMAELERLIDEYYEASRGDRRRVATLAAAILEQARAAGLDGDCGIAASDDPQAALRKLDGLLCEIKELQIRDGLHVFGSSPAGERLDALLVAFARPGRGAAAEDASLVRALAADLDLGEDPLDLDLAAPWTGPRPTALAGDICPLSSLGGGEGWGEVGDAPRWRTAAPPHLIPQPPPFPPPLAGEGSGGRGRRANLPWRTAGDTVERLEALALRLVAGEARAEAGWPRTGAVLDWIERHLRPAVARCGEAEIAGLLAGLDGRLVPPGPSGAPSRGRPEVLPTGRNFYSVDIRAVPTQAAWQLGWKSAALLLERHAQEHGAYPARVVLSAWGTANMRTGGDDIAQALALLGVQPVWERASGRVTGFEIMPASVLDRPRVDVTLRVSGFFRDAFPGLIDLVDSAVRAVAALDEPASVNPLAARVAADRDALEAEGAAPAEAQRRAGYRIFGAKPGGYGAGLQRLIDERAWDDESDLAEAWLAASGYAYDAGGEGRPERAMLEARLAGADAVLHNQDNREHDLLDSGDYWQFEGGLALVVRQLSGRTPAVYHNDHSRPETPRIRSLARGIGAGRPRPGGEPALDRRRDAPRLQGCGRDRRHGRLPVRLRRDRAGGRRRAFRGAVRRLSRRRPSARLYRRQQPGGAGRHQPPFSRGDRPRLVAPAPQQRPRRIGAMEPGMSSGTRISLSAPEGGEGRGEVGEALAPHQDSAAVGAAHLTLPVADATGPPPSPPASGRRG